MNISCWDSRPQDSPRHQMKISNGSRLLSPPRLCAPNPSSATVLLSKPTLNPIPSSFALPSRIIDAITADHTILGWIMYIPHSIMHQCNRFERSHECRDSPTSCTPLIHCPVHPLGPSFRGMSFHGLHTIQLGFEC